EGGPVVHRSGAGKFVEVDEVVEQESAGQSRRIGEPGACQEEDESDGGPAALVHVFNRSNEKKGRLRGPFVARCLELTGRCSCSGTTSAESRCSCSAIRSNRRWSRPRTSGRSRRWRQQPSASRWRGRRCTTNRSR